MNNLQKKDLAIQPNPSFCLNGTLMKFPVSEMHCEKDEHNSVVFHERNGS